MRLPESIVYMTLCNPRGLQHVHISAKQLFHTPLHPLYLPDSGRHVTSIHQGLSQAGAWKEPGYQVERVQQTVTSHVVRWRELLNF